MPRRTRPAKGIVGLPAFNYTRGMSVLAAVVPSLHERVLTLKRTRRAVVLAHNYQIQEVKGVADFLGDSYALSDLASRAEGDWIVFCGVRFMAETAKLLNPSRRVVLPESGAGCDLADSIDAKGLRGLKAVHPGVPVVMYINSSVEVKAESDAICTSSNALKVLEAMPGDRVIFGPDRNLAAWVSKKSRKTVIPWNGYCPVHEKMGLDVIRDTMAKHPGAYVIVHPECPPDVQAEADEILSTSQMLVRAGQIDAREFIIGTEIGLIEQLRKLHPGRTFHPAYEHTSCDDSCACPFMKMTKLSSVARALETGEEEIRIAPALQAKALKAVARMLEIGK